MPIYEYECDGCRSRFERRQGFHDEPVTECPECQGSVRRLIHPAPIIFKGSGFYVTDSRGRNPATDAAAAAEAPASGDAATAGESGAAGDKASAGTEKTPVGTAAPAAPEKSAAGGEAGESKV